MSNRDPDDDWRAGTDWSPTTVAVAALIAVVVLGAMGYEVNYRASSDEGRQPAPSVHSEG
jgi:hypothetical protein